MRRSLVILVCLFVLSFALGQEKRLLKDLSVLDRMLLDERQDLYRIITNEGSVYFQNGDGEVREFPYYMCGAVGPSTRPLYEIKQRDTLVSLLESTEDIFNPGLYFDPKIIDEFVVKKGEEVYFTNYERKITMDSYSSFIKEFFIIKEGKISFSSEPDIWYDDINKLLDGGYIVKKDGYFGLYKKTDLKYQDLRQMNSFLLYGVLDNGKIVYIDKKGREYFPSTSSL